MSLALPLAAALCTALSTSPPAADPAAPPSPPSAHGEGGEEPSDVLELLGEAVVSTASKAAESETATPAASVSISAEDLQRYGIHSLDEAINFLSLGMVTQNPLHSVDVGARGVLLTADFGNHLLLLLNGHALNEPWAGSAYFERGAAIPFELVDHIEIILGPGSVLYVPNAMLGVINVVTKRAKDFEGVHLVLQGEGPHPSTGDLATAGRVALGFGERFTLLGRASELTGQVEYYKQAGPSFTFGPQQYGDDSVTGAPKQFNADGSSPGVWGGKADRSYYTHLPLGYARLVVGETQLEARAASYKRATPYLNDFNQVFGDFNEGQSFELDQWLDLELKHRRALSALAELNVRLYGDLYRFLQILRTSAAEDCSPGLSRCLRQVAGQSRWGGLEAQLGLDWLHDARLVTVAGAEGRGRDVRAGYDVLDQVQQASQLAFGHFAVKALTGGLYLQQTARPLPWLDLNVRLRYDADPRFGGHLSPRAAVRLVPWEGGTLKAIYSEAFRSPSDYEQNYVEPNAQIRAQPLRPEVVRSVEAILEEALGAQRLLVAAYYSRWTDLIVLEPVAEGDPGLAEARQQGLVDLDAQNIVQARNSSALTNYGLNAAFEGSLRRGALRYGLNLTLARTRRDGSDDTLPVAPQWFGNAHVSYEPPGLLPRLGLAASYLARRPADRAFDGGFTPVPYAPAQLELRATAWGPLPFLERLSYQLSVDWAAAAVGPYVVGPNQAATAAQPGAELVPVDRFHAMLGLRLDL